MVGVPCNDWLKLYAKYDAYRNQATWESNRTMYSIIPNIQLHKNLLMQLQYNYVHDRTSSDKDYKNVLFVSVGTNSDEAAAQYAKTNALLSSLMEEGRLESWSNASAFAVGETEQRRRIERWKAYWSDAKAEEVASELREAGRAEGFRPDAFDSFIALLTKDYRPLDLFAEGAVPEALGTFFSRSEKNDMLVSQARIPVADRESIYALFGADKNLVVFDQGWFVNKAASTINDDFNFILWFSSLLIFIVLCVN